MAEHRFTLALAIVCVLAPLSFAQDFRKWTTSSGQPTRVNLAAIEVVGNSVRFRREDDMREFTFPIQRLSAEDQQAVRDQFGIEESASEQGPRDGRDITWPEPVITDENLDQWADFLWPSEKDLRWRNVRWHNNLGDAIHEARRLDRPILLWTMNGNPCGET